MAGLNEKDLGHVLQAEFHYTYKANKGNLIAIEVGDEFILIKKSNDDWWQVIKQDQKKPFYVPAAYMRELNRHVYPDHTYFKKAFSSMQKQKKKLHSSQSPGPSIEEQFSRFSKDHNQNVGSRENLAGLSSKSKYSSLRASSDSLDHFIDNENPYDEVPYESKFLPKQPHSEYKRNSMEKYHEEPEYENIELVQKRIMESRLSPTTTSNQTDDSFDFPLPPDEREAISEVEEKPDSSSLSDRRRSFDPISSPTTIEIPKGEWVVQLDDQTNYFKTETDQMENYKPPDELDDVLHVETNEPTSVVRIVPPAVPDASMKPTLQRSNLSPEPEEKPSPTERRRASPADFTRRSSLPDVIDVGTTIADKRPIPFLAVKAANKNNSNSVERNLSFRDRFFRDSKRKKNKNKHKKSNSDATFLLDRPVEQEFDDGRLQALPGWVRERSSEGDVTFIRKSNGDRWHQMYDDHTEKYYYYNELTNQTSWHLPEFGLHEEIDSSPDLQVNRYADDDISLIGRNSQLRDTAVRKASTIERDTLPDYFKDDIASHSNTLSKDALPPVAVKPRKSRGFQKQVERVMVAQSMYIQSPSQQDHLADDRLSQLLVQSKKIQSALDQALDRRVVKAWIKYAMFKNIRNSNDRENSFVPITHPMIKRQGRLYWTKLMEAGKKQRKHWIQQWVVLLSNNLLFYKDEKQAQTTKSSPHGKPDSSCELRGATVDWGHEKSSKKNVIELQTVRGLSLLLQHEDQTTINKWLTAIKEAIETANQADDFVSSKHISIDEEDEIDFKRKKERKKSKKATRQNSDAKNSDNVRTRLKKFISRRPTLESLQERGIIKETVFGCPLAKLCEKEKTTVPNFVKLCVEEVEKRGLDIDGIYRVSGNLSHVQKLRCLIDQNEEVNLGDVQWDDIHLITGALKMFLRELPEPVIPFDFFDKFIASCKIKDDRSRVQAMKGLVDVLPCDNGDTLRYLMKHFRNVVDHSSKNRMQVQNIAIVFGPTLLLKPPDDSKTDPAGSSHMAVYMVYQNQIIDEMLMHYEHIFG